MTGRAFALWVAAPSQRFGGERPANQADDAEFLTKAAGDLSDL